MMTTSDPVIGALAALSAAPPASLVDRLVTGWIKLPGPIGELYLAFTDEGVSYLRTAESMRDNDEDFLEAYRNRFGRPLRHASAPPAGLPAALRGRSPRTLKLDLRGLSEFDRAVLEATRRIPSGQVRPYRWVATEIGRPGAVRAVGSALGRNPVPMLIPCHRVIRSNGEPGDYVFGAGAKQRLLRAERVDLAEVDELARANVFYIGSDTTGIVCFPTCHHARRITRPHRRGFRTIGEAELAGYRPCKACRPAA
jgi:methylated-DNA-[protein]-cysteine S-methyltransferase